MVGWGHRGYGGSGTENVGTKLRTGATTSEDAEVWKDKQNEDERRTKRGIARQDIRVERRLRSPSPTSGRGVGEAHILSQEQVESVENSSEETDSTNQPPFNDKSL